MVSAPGSALAEVERLLEVRPVESPAPPAGLVFPAVGPALIEAIRRAAPRKVVLQVPAGLVRNAHDLAAELRSDLDVPVEVLTRACFGACDLPRPEESGGPDVAVVLGHSPIPNVRPPMPTFFVEMRYAGGDPERLVALLGSAGVPGSIGLVSSVQHLDLVEGFRAAAERRGYRVKMGKGDRRLAYSVQALGCNYTGAQEVADAVEAYVFLGTGRFHPIGLALATERPVWTVDPLQSTLDGPLDRAMLVRDRLLLVERARPARRWGILVSSFVGQDRTGMARSLQERAQRRGKEAEILRFDRLDPADLLGRDLDAYVCTACPRIAIDDSSLYERPMLTAPEFLMAIGDLPLEPYRFDTFH